MIDKSGFKLNRVISPETKYMHLMEAVQEAELRFLLASLKGETFRVSGKGQSKISSKKWKN
ncbi:MULTISPECIES: hypothetical protein [Methanobacterium]|uniref:Uncharacterized protein n=1 Tax=Methanobacterium veterum TaxID=408577 RepID=A0A9E4ZYX0_9EURY|nr:MULTISPECIES: hypothetical protein [Methanobacterium]MCZ3364895.1 hypothetical protein [Methanobacterium veterum]MCZ3372650.1 hypothetical protein [Methanobacterium veterum]